VLRDEEQGGGSVACKILNRRFLGKSGVLHLHEIQLDLRMGVDFGCDSGHGNSDCMVFSYPRL
jgi:hypothetical protein